MKIATETQPKEHLILIAIEDLQKLKTVEPSEEAKLPPPNENDLIEEQLLESKKQKLTQIELRLCDDFVKMQSLPIRFQLQIDWENRKDLFITIQT